MKDKNNLAIDIFENKNIGINSLDVAKCKMYSDLRKWKLALEIEINLVTDKLRLSEAEFKSGQSDGDPIWYAKTKGYRSKQVLLKKQVEFRMRQIKENSEYKLSHFRAKFWKDKVRYLAPNKVEEWQAELTKKIESNF